MTLRDFICKTRNFSSGHNSEIRNSAEYMAAILNI